MIDKWRVKAEMPELTEIKLLNSQKQHLFIAEGGREGGTMKGVWGGASFSLYL